MQVPEDEQDTVGFLILHHLALSEVMTGRDLSDPATARALADRVGTIERLKMLAVLTFADISGVNPGAMTPWRMEQLWRVYRIAQQELTRELETDRITDVPQDLAGADFIRGFPVRYLRTHSPAEIQRHVRLYELSRPTGVAAEIRQIDGSWRAEVVARDMPFLFASLAGALSSFGLDILKAEAFSNAKGLILDTFVFADPRRTLELNPSEADRLRDLLGKVAAGKQDVQKLLKARPQTDGKRAGEPPSVLFDSDACETATLVEIVTEDRPGLLHNLAMAFSSAACNIDVVLIDTKGKRAIDVFYVAHQGSKLTPETQAALKERLLAAC
jgi:[protein-PII] uridylyltransferase